jgi:hypothetical protein
MVTKIKYNYTHEANEAIQNLVDLGLPIAVSIGIDNAEPLLIILDSIIRYCKAHEARFGSKIGMDYIACEHIKSMLSGVKGMFNFDGGVAMERQSLGLSCLDSKDSSMMSEMTSVAMEIAGIEEL